MGTGLEVVGGNDRGLGEVAHGSGRDKTFPATTRKKQGALLEVNG
jgi:hypothetical protein